MPFTDIPHLVRHYAGQASSLINDFYVPVLREAVRYDRQSGYFNSSALIQIASGLSVFIQRFRNSIQSNPYPMRLITGATWTDQDRDAFQMGHAALQESLGLSLARCFEPTDEECARLGLPRGWRPSEDRIAMNRLGTLAWMVSRQLLDVRVALPLDHDGRPWPPGRQGALFHTKSGLLYDERGDVVAFQGSVNETSAAWARNREKFWVRRSWVSEQDWEDIKVEQKEFEQIWQARDPGLLVLEMPRAVRDYLRHFQPQNDEPEIDPLIFDYTAKSPLPRFWSVAQRYLDAPLQPDGESLVLSPLWADGAPLTLYPHQRHVSARAADGYPRSYLFCDEVGLGKTIEVGAALRKLVITRKAERILIVSPRGLVRQWMEELREKFALTAWFYDGEGLTDVGGRHSEEESPLDLHGVLIVSRHLIARKDRMTQVLGIDAPWDLVIVDEAHAARCSNHQRPEPNQLLRLLQTMRRRDLCKSLWLLTATPLQIHPREVHDLLLLCGLDDHAWGGWSGLNGFEAFFNDLRDFPSQPDARIRVAAMCRIAVKQGAPGLNQTSPPKGWSSFEWKNMTKRMITEVGLALALQRMTGKQAEAMTPLLARQTPLAVHMFRHTRATLRAYQEKGLLTGGLALRMPVDVPVELTDDEKALYERIDELCRDFYQHSASPRNGLGFLMAVFRKRLSSSFAAFRQSLEDRLARINAALERSVIPCNEDPSGAEDILDALDDEDEKAFTDARQAEASQLREIVDSPSGKSALEREREYLHNYLNALRKNETDSKFETFRAQLAQIVNDGSRVIVFTQFLDTLDFIRDHLVHGHGNKLACYTGRGGEIWDARQCAWRTVDKAEIKARSKPDHPESIQVLLGTEAASEGLNLQHYAALFNYDLPWNPMRIEQRIGRIDRIGQQSTHVRILNLYARGTIEEDAYRTLKDRIGLFKDVVGPLQPILAEMPKILHQVACGELELETARKKLAASSTASPVHGFSLDNGAIPTDVPETRPAKAGQITQVMLADWCLKNLAPGMRIEVVSEPGAASVPNNPTDACLAITWTHVPPHLGIDPTDTVLATFNGALADRHPPTAQFQTKNIKPNQALYKEGIRLLTWGDPFLEAWLQALHENFSER